MRRIVFVVVAAGVVLGVACSFPDIEFAPQADGGANASEAGLDATISDSGKGGETGPTDGGVKIEYDANIPIDDAGGTVISNPSACDGSCDCDGDGFYRGDAGCDGGAAPDCDDLDSRTHPGAGGRYDPAVPPRNGDWNCDGTVTRLVQEHFACADYSPLLSSGSISTSCTTYDGFLELTVPCGGTGTLQSCTDPTLGILGNCKNGDAGTARQACQ
jgi:hypothetical protein